MKDEGQLSNRSFFIWLSSFLIGKEILLTLSIASLLSCFLSAPRLYQAGDEFRELALDLRMFGRIL